MHHRPKKTGQGQCAISARWILEEPPAKDGDAPKDKSSATTAIMIVIVINTCTDAWAGARPEQDTVEFQTKFWVNNICLIFYMGEMLLKMVAYGLWKAPDAYLRRSWCVFDLIVVSSMIIDLGMYLASGGEGVSLQFFRVLRALKPIRSAKGFENLRVIVETIAQGAKRFAATAFASALFIMLAAVVGVNLWGLGGDFHRFCTVSVASGGQPQSINGSGQNRSLLPPPSGSARPVRGSRVIAVPAMHCSSTSMGYACADPTQECTLIEGSPAMDGLHSLDNVFEAMLAVWTVSLRDSFSFVLHPSARVAGPWASMLFYIIVVVFGFAILNYFTAFYVLGYMERLKRFEITKVHTDTLTLTGSHDSEEPGPTAAHGAGVRLEDEPEPQQKRQQHAPESAVAPRRGAGRSTGSGKLPREGSQDANLNGAGRAGTGNVTRVKLGHDGSRPAHHGGTERPGHGSAEAGGGVEDSGWHAEPEQERASARLGLGLGQTRSMGRALTPSQAQAHWQAQAGAEAGAQAGGSFQVGPDTRAQTASGGGGGRRNVKRQPESSGLAVTARSRLRLPADVRGARGPGSESLGERFNLKLAAASARLREAGAAVLGARAAGAAEEGGRRFALACEAAARYPNPSRRAADSADSASASASARARGSGGWGSERQEAAM